MTQKPRKKRIGFLVLRHIHQIYHIAPIAFELSRCDDFEVTIFISYQSALPILRDLEGHYRGHKCSVKLIKQSWVRILANPTRLALPRPKNVLRNNMRMLLDLDAIASADYYSNFLIHKAGNKQPKFIFTFHGAGDGPHGFKDALRLYDFLLISGDKVRRRLDKQGVLDHVSWAIVGYCKFDVTLKREASRLFHNDRPTVLYNPHFSKRTSSWSAWGMKVLEIFYHSDRFNLIFAPHLMLFVNDKIRIPAKFLEASHIHIDMGSRDSVEMTYTRQSDIYLGDGSSQVYEFLIEPRPCIFLNPNKIDWNDNEEYYHWSLGKVVNDLRELKATLDSAFETHPLYRPIQLEYFADTFSVEKTPAALRAARAISAYLKNPT